MIILIMLIITVYDWAFVCSYKSSTIDHRTTCEKLHDILNAAGKWKATPQGELDETRDDASESYQGWDTTVFYTNYK